MKSQVLLFLTEIELINFINNMLLQGLVEVISDSGYLGNGQRCIVLRRDSNVFIIGNKPIHVLIHGVLLGVFDVGQIEQLESLLDYYTNLGYVFNIPFIKSIDGIQTVVITTVPNSDQFC
jgi:hypothetical protein